METNLTISLQTDFKCALAIVPLCFVKNSNFETDKLTVEEIEDIRKKYDTAYNRWPPHVNLLFPYFPVEKFESNQTLLSEELNQTFILTFDSIDFFTNKNLSTFYLKLSKESENFVNNLHNSIIKKISIIPEHEKFVPHLTIARCEKQLRTIMYYDLREMIKLPIFIRMKVVQLSRATNSDDRMIEIF